MGSSKSKYKKDSLSLTGTVALGTGVMIGAGIFTLLGQVAALAGDWFPIVFLVGALISAFSSYTYIKVSDAYPSAGGIAMILKKSYGKGTITASASLLMAFSMVISESLVARTFGTYTLQLFGNSNDGLWIPILGVLLLIFAFLINISGNNVISKSSFGLAVIKIGGLSIFAIVALWVSSFSVNNIVPSSSLGDNSFINYLGALALSILAYKGFTTITNSGDEVVNPHKNVGKAIIISLVICTVIYLLVALSVSAQLSISEIIKAKDFSLAEAARPAFGDFGLWFTVGIAIVATASGVVASTFAVSRMTAMLSNMKLIPHNHFGMSGTIQKHMLVYAVVIAIILTTFFNLSRIAALGAIFYLIMDVIVHWGVLRHIRKEVKAKSFILITAIVFDLIALGSFLWIKFNSDNLVIIVSLIIIFIVFAGERWFLKTRTGS